MNSSNTEQDLVYRLARSVVSSETADRLPELESRFDQLYEELKPLSATGPVSDNGGLPFDVPSMAWTAVSAVIWISASFIHEAIRHSDRRKQGRALRRLEAKLAVTTADPVLVNAVLRRLERLIDEVGDLRSIVAGKQRPRSADHLQDYGSVAESAAVRNTSKTIAAQPDLEIVVALEWRGHARVLSYDCSASEPALRLNHTKFFSAPLKTDPETYLTDLYRMISGLSLDSSEDRKIAARRIASKGAELSRQLLPDDLQERLWAHRSELTTLLIQTDSESAPIPWELVKLRPPESSGASGPFLCEAFELARWLPGVGKVLRFPVITPAIVVPRSSRLANAPLERRDLKDLFACHERDVKDVGAEYMALIEALESGAHDAWHFTGHGLVSHSENPNSWEIGLDGRGRLRPDDLGGLKIGASLVFLNACHTGRTGPSLTALGGWSGQFLAAGAGAFIGCHWAVPDDKAREFAVAFYRRFLEGAPIGRAVREARLELRDRYPGNPTWLGYTLFADPRAVAAASKPPQRPPERVTATEALKSSPTEPRPQSPETPRPSPTRTKSTAETLGALRNASIGAPEATRVESAKGLSPTEPRPREERIHEIDKSVLVYVPGGQFTLGDDEGREFCRPAHIVTLSPFWIGKYPVTNEQFAQFLAAFPDRERPASWSDPRFNQPRQPVVGVSWHDAMAYCEWASLSLPTEAQWEAAARGEDCRIFPWSNEAPDSKRAQFGNRDDAPKAIGSYPAGTGPFGILDQAGGVWEWCLDEWDLTAYRGREDRELDPIGRKDPAMRPVRGGSWSSPGQDLQTTVRNGVTATQRLNDQGFRCVWKPR